jgi:uncharacterized protein (TIGR00297 family)
MNREIKRKAVHISMAVFALAVGRLPNWMIVLCCLAALLMNAFVLPRLTKGALERDVDRDRGFALGILMYPGILLALSLLFYQMQVFLVIAWAAMAFGDGFAGVIGSWVKGQKLPWAPQKSWAGLLAFWLFGGSLGFVWLALLPEETLLGLPLSLWSWILAVGVLAAGVMETVDGFIDDNLIVPLSAAVMSFLAFLTVTHGVLPPAWPGSWELGLGLVVLFSLVAIGLRKITFAGGLVGGLLAWFIFAGGGFVILALLLFFFVIGTFASKWRMKEKAKLNLAQENRGIRGVNNALANGGVAGLCGLAGWLIPEMMPVFAVMAGGSLAAATSDTLSSEFGNLYGHRYVNVLNLRPDQRGRDGAISLEGSLFGVAGALVCALIVVALSGDGRAAVIVALAGVFGNYIDSVLGAVFQRRGLMTNDTVNAGNTALAAVFAMVLYGFWA